MVGEATGQYSAVRAELLHSRVPHLLVELVVELGVSRGHLSSSRLRDSRESRTVRQLRDLLLGRAEVEVVVGAPLAPEALRAEFFS